MITTSHLEGILVHFFFSLNISFVHFEKVLEHIDVYMYIQLWYLCISLLDLSLASRHLITTSDRI